MKKYKAQARWGVKVEAVECDKETESSVWIKGRRNKKHTAYENYFDTFDEAKRFCISQWERNVASARKSLEDANSRLGNAKGLKDPTL